MEEKCEKCEKCTRHFYSLSDEPDYKCIKVSRKCRHCYYSQDKTDEEIEDQNWELLGEQNNF